MNWLQHGKHGVLWDCIPRGGCLFSSLAIQFDPGVSFYCRKIIFSEAEGAQWCCLLHKPTLAVNIPVKGGFQCCSSAWCTSPVLTAGGDWRTDGLTDLLTDCEIAGQRAPPLAHTYISPTSPAPLDCLLHSGLAGRHSWLWTEPAAVLTVGVTPGTLQWSRWTSTSTSWQGTCRIIWRIKWKSGCSVRVWDCLWCWALAQRTPATTCFQ